ncbi:polysaccharide biosynthesis tyrosine autokinase [Massilia glaciei]|uniref:Putative tyrosine-protein kinase EpsB n=1 Tax=Massilia glaciei TaxID=1524097 RepID=A0A2U2HN18_9BURK|nr:polysaccharide biosynthesis tyrosine autokinase [Massilia glaciei]PWF48911.1 tyrosine protein kinase [Massilia glaciei]
MNESASQNALIAGKAFDQDDDAINLASYLDLLFDNRWLIAVIAFVVTVLGTAYAYMSTPVYQANILVQVEDSASSSKNILGDLSSVFDLKTAATAEMEILRSRFVVTRAVNNALLYIRAEPKYFPVVGRWIARSNKELTEPGLFGIGGYVWGPERIEVTLFNVPVKLEGLTFVLTAMGNDSYRVTLPGGAGEFSGKLGQIASSKVGNGTVELRVDALSGLPGARFKLLRSPILGTVEKLQGSLNIAEKGKQSGIIGVSMQGPDPRKTAGILNHIGLEYIRQNVDRKSEEAEKSLAFLDKQLPEMKANLEEAEVKYNTLRNSRGTIDLSEEAKTVLQQSVMSQTRMVELKQKRDELLTRFQSSNPLVEAVTQQMRTLSAELDSVNSKIKRLPSVEQDVFRLTRDVKVNTDLYTALLNSAQQLRLVKASKVGNARLLDVAEIPLNPVRPKRAIVIALAALVGLFLGVVGAFIRKNLFGGIDDPHEIEHRLGLPVSAAVAHSEKQELLYELMQSDPKKVSVLAHDDPSDPAIESLRSFRTSLQFSMLSAKNNIVMISGPTPTVGKSFVSVNFAAVLASTGKKVLLIDADLRKGYLQRYFGLKRKDGLSELIAGQHTLEQAIHRNVVENLDFISTGVLPPRPAELLAHEHFAECLRRVSALYDIVIIDSAPVLAVADALVIGTHSGTIFNIVRGGVTTMGEIEESVKRFRQAGTSITGIVFNDLKPRMGRYGYGSKYGKYRYAQYKY